jgi:hypothetical protein
LLFEHQSFRSILILLGLKNVEQDQMSMHVKQMVEWISEWFVPCKCDCFCMWEGSNLTPDNCKVVLPKIINQQYVRDHQVREEGISNSSFWLYTWKALKKFSNRAISNQLKHFCNVQREDSWEEAGTLWSVL